MISDEQGADESRFGAYGSFQSFFGLADLTATGTDDQFYGIFSLKSQEAKR